MTLEYVDRSHNPRLILIFAGWAMDSTPFRSLAKTGYDIAVASDYTSFDFDFGPIMAEYAEICIVAWSLGVVAADLCYPQLEARATLRIAVNGTVTPVDDRRGIPPTVFGGTLAGLSEQSLLKFYRRTAGSRKAFEAFQELMPQRSLQSVTEELATFYPPRDYGAARCPWDLAIISRNDAIFPPENMLRAWEGKPVEFIDEAHLPDFGKILERHVVNKQLVGSRFGKRRDSYESGASVQAEIVERLEKKMSGLGIDALIADTDSSVLEIGCGTGLLSRRLDRLAGGHVTMWDIVGESPVAGARRYFRRCDAETAIGTEAPASFDLIISASTVQWFNSPLHFLERAAEAVKPGGFIVLSTFSPGNLTEVEQCTGRSLPLLSADGWRASAPASLETIAVETYDYPVRFDSPIDVFRHLSRTGVNSLGSDVNLRTAMRNYPASNDGSATVTYRPLILVFRKK